LGDYAPIDAGDNAGINLMGTLGAKENARRAKGGDCKDAGDCVERNWREGGESESDKEREKF
jgi:hypothetical protein